MFAIAPASSESKLLTAKHLHVMQNRLPVTGLAVVILALALMHHGRKAEIIALILVFVAATSALPVNPTAQRAYKMIREIADDAADTDWPDMHTERAENTAPAFCALALLAQKAPHHSAAGHRHARACVVCAGGGGWVALAGGQIRHPGFRGAPPPESEAAPHHH
jgi:hypothetical protein